jgi:hypothetical protein
MPSPLVHPRMLAELVGAGFYPDRMAIQRRTDTKNADGEAIAGYVTITGLEDIPVRLTPITLKRGDEVRAPSTTYQSSEFFLHAAGYFPQITVKMRAVITRPEGPLVFDILATALDSLSVTTKLEGQIIL